MIEFFRIFFAVFLMVLAITLDPLCLKRKKKTDEIVTEGTEIEIGIVIVTEETVTETEIVIETGTEIETVTGTEETGIGIETGKRKGHISRNQQRRYHKINFLVFLPLTINHLCLYCYKVLKCSVC